MSRPKQFTQQEVYQLLGRLAMWFDNPHLSPSMALTMESKRYTPGMLLREIGSELTFHPDVVTKFLPKKEAE